MARRKTRRTTRGRVGSVRTRGKATQDILFMVGGAIAGGSAAVYADNMMGDKIPQKGKAIGKLAVGAIVAKESKQPFIQGIGLGLATAGGAQLLKDVGVLSGIGDDWMDGVDDYMSGDLDYNEGDLDMMAGDEEMYVD